MSWKVSLLQKEGEAVFENLNWPILGQQIGLGALLGLAVGYTAKKALKIGLIIMGILALTLLLLETYEFITINWENIENFYETLVDNPSGILGHLTEWAKSLASSLPLAGSFIAGFLIGLRIK